MLESSDTIYNIKVKTQDNEGLYHDTYCCVQVSPYALSLELEDNHTLTESLRLQLSGKMVALEVESSDTIG